MLKFIATIFLLFGCFTLGLALYYGKKIGIIKVFNEVKDLKQKDELKESLPDEYGYEDEIYEDISSEDLRNARMDESENLSEKKVLAPVNERRNKERTKQEKESEGTSIMENTVEDSGNETSFMDAETSFMDNQNNQNSMIADDESTSFMETDIMDSDAGEEETSFMQISNNSEENQKEASFVKNSASSENDETVFMTNASPSEQSKKEIQEDIENDETSFMNLKISINNVESSDIPDDEETSFM